jgi:hypothetical protein
MLEAISVSSIGSIGKMFTALKVMGEDMTVEWWIALIKVSTCRT